MLAERIRFSKDEYTDIFLKIAFGYIIVCWIGLILSEFRIFYPIIVLPLVFLVVTSVLILVINNIRNIVAKISKRNLMIIIPMFLLVLFNTILFHDSFMGGIDSGTMSNAAVYLARTGSVFIENDQMFFPGLIVQGDGYIVGFHLGYISWLGIQYLIFGLWGVAMGNFLPHLIGIGAMFLIIRNLQDNTAAFAGVMIFETSYPLIWFTRGNFNEIFSFALVFVTALCLITWFRNRSWQSQLLGLLTISFFMYVRIEAVALLITYVILSVGITLSAKNWRLMIFQISSAFVLLLHYVLYSIIHIPWEYFGSRIDSSDIDWGVGIVGGLIQAITDLFNPTKPNTFIHNTTDFIFRIFIIYGLIWIILLFIIGSVWYFGQSLKGKHIDKALIVLYILPVCIYLLTPFTDPWQPWFLKRYIFAIIPVGIIISMVFLKSALNKKQVYRKTFVGIILLAIILNLFIAQPVLFHRDHLTAIDQVGVIASNFDADDVVLVDRNLAGFYKIGEPLFFVYGIYSMWVGQNGTWCGFDKINMTKLSEYNIYVLIHPASVWLYEYLDNYTLQHYFNSTFSYSHLDWTINLHSYGVYFLETNYTEVIEQISIPNQVTEYSYPFSAYEIIL